MVKVCVRLNQEIADQVRDEVRGNQEIADQVRDEVRGNEEIADRVRDEVRGSNQGNGERGINIFFGVQAVLYISFSLPLQIK